jgi:hypothetical protein
MNRKNGKERPAPGYCPSCKSSLWDTERVNCSAWDRDIDRRMRMLRMTRGQRFMEKVNRWYDEHPIELYSRTQELKEGLS